MAGFFEQARGGRRWLPLLGEGTLGDVDLGFPFTEDKSLNLDRQALAGAAWYARRPEALRRPTRRTLLVTNHLI